MFERQLLYARAAQRVALATYIGRYKKRKGATEGVQFGRPFPSYIYMSYVVDAPWKPYLGPWKPYVASLTLEHAGQQSDRHLVP